MFLKAGRLIVLSCIVLPPLLLAARLPAAKRTSADAATVFQDRVAAYVALHRQCAERLLVTNVEPDSSGEATFRETLRDSIRFARRHAQPGDILCPALAPRILQLVRTDLAAREPLERA